jgi:hypothetical protein
VTLGSTALIIFTTWSLIAYRANAEARRAARPDADIVVRHDSGVWHFTSRAGSSDTVARSYSFRARSSIPEPMRRSPGAAAHEGYPAFIIELPRGAFGGADDPELRVRVHRVLSTPRVVSGWVAAGHSRGAVVVSDLAVGSPEGLAGIVLIGTSHPRDVDLSSSRLPITKIVGTRDGLATRAEVEQNRARLPSSTKWVWIEGGNHSQFGWYGFQPFDRPAAISAADQREWMIGSMLETLRSASSNHQ